MTPWLPYFLSGIEHHRLGGNRRKCNKTLNWIHYFNGTLDPIKLSARFGIYNEVIEIRANWDVEGIMITIKKYDE